MDAQTENVLVNIMQEERRSLLQYVRDSFPWTTSEEGDALDRLRAIIGEERCVMGELARFLQRRRITPPPFLSYPASFTTINYAALDHMLPLLAAEEDRASARLEQGLKTSTDPEARALIQKILDLKRHHQKVLQSLADAHPDAVTR